MYINETYENELLDKVKKTDWRQYKGPKDYAYKKVYPAFEDLVLLREEKNKLKVSSDLKYAVGNDHGARYYPAVLSALPFLIDLLTHSEREPVRNCALEILSDWISFFEPELGSYTAIQEDELARFVSHAIRDYSENPAAKESTRNEELLAGIRTFLLR